MRNVTQYHSRFRQAQDAADRQGSAIALRWRSGQLSESAARWELAAAILSSSIIDQVLERDSLHRSEKQSLLALETRDRVEAVLLAKVTGDERHSIALDLDKLADGAKLCAWARVMCMRVVASEAPRIRAAHQRCVALPERIGEESHEPSGSNESEDAIIEHLAIAVRKAMAPERPQIYAEALRRMYHLPPVERGIAVPGAEVILRELSKDPAGSVVTYLADPRVQALLGAWSEKQVRWLRSSTEAKLAGAAMLTAALSPRYPSRKAALARVAERISQVAGCSHRAARAVVSRWDNHHAEVASSAFDATRPATLKTPEQRDADAALWRRAVEAHLPMADLADLDAALGELLWEELGAATAA